MKALALAALAAAAALAAMPVDAQNRASRADRITRVTIYGTQACPRGDDGEIIICGRRRSQDRFRIPEALREDAGADDPENVSWAARAESLEYAGRTGIQSCSPVGPGGNSGCLAELIRTARGERTKGEGDPGR
ncbi:MAG TPA: hypothetical protein VIA98_13825 [Allosphingosinicella sp.]|jgi:hypothetical protein